MVSKNVAWKSVWLMQRAVGALVIGGLGALALSYWKVDLRLWQAPSAGVTWALLAYQACLFGVMLKLAWVSLASLPRTQPFWEIEQLGFEWAMLALLALTALMVFLVWPYSGPGWQNKAWTVVGGVSLAGACCAVTLVYGNLVEDPYLTSNLHVMRWHVVATLPLVLLYQLTPAAAGGWVALAVFSRLLSPVTKELAFPVETTVSEF